MTRSPLILAGVAALMGAAGVALAAAGVHANGGELAERGALFLLLHACRSACNRRARSDRDRLGARAS